jgi:hypothetical protein
MRPKAALVVPSPCGQIVAAIWRAQIFAIEWQVIDHYSLRSNGFYFPGDCPHKGAELTGYGTNYGLVFLASGNHFSVAGTESHLCLPGNVSNYLWQPFLSLKQCLADASRKSIGMGRFDENFSHVAIAGLGDASGPPGAAA